MTIPTRTCVACRQRRDKRSLIRLVSDGGAVTVDAAARKPGRGAYVCPDASCLDIALRRGGGGLHRALRQRASVDEVALRSQFEQVAAAPIPQQPEVSA